MVGWLVGKTCLVSHTVSALYVFVSHRKQCDHMITSESRTKVVVFILYNPCRGVCTIANKRDILRYIFCQLICGPFCLSLSVAIRVCFPLMFFFYLEQTTTVKPCQSNASFIFLVFKTLNDVFFSKLRL